MNKREAYELGKDRGECISSWVDIPEIGEEVPKHIDWVGYGVVTQGNLADVMEMYAFESESNDRQNSPFEFTAQEFNSQKPGWRVDGIWEEFDRGIAMGIRKEIRKRLEDYA